MEAPARSGDNRELRTFSPSDKPVAGSAWWSGSELIVEAADAGSIALFDLLLPNIERCRITYRVTIDADALKAPVYPELWCRIPERGLFFSRGVDRKVSGHVEGVELEIPFYLEAGQRADLIHLNLAFDGARAVRLRDIRVSMAEVGA